MVEVGPEPPGDTVQPSSLFKGPSLDASLFKGPSLDAQCLTTAVTANQRVVFGWKVAVLAWKVNVCLRLVSHVIKSNQQTIQSVQPSDDSTC